MANKNPTLVVLGVIAFLAGGAVFFLNPLQIFSAKLANSTLNGALGGLLAGLGVALYLQKAKRVR